MPDIAETAATAIAGPVGGVAVAFFEKYWKVIVVLILLIATGVYISVLRSDNADLTHKLEISAISLKLSEDGRTQLKQDIASQNKQIENLQMLGQQAASNASQASSNAANIGVQFSKTVSSIMAQQTPIGCAPAIKYLSDGIGELKWEKK